MDGELFSSADLDQELIEKENRKKERERLALLEKKEEAKKKEKEEAKESVTLDKTLYLLDGYSIIYKSYYAFISRPLTDKNGNNISAYYGFFQTLFHILKDNRMDGLAITMDEREPTFRHLMYPEYKANRDKAPDDLHKSVEPIKATLKKMHIPVLSKSGYEADDVMASVSRKAAEYGWKTVIVTGDKDLCQLVSDTVSILRPPKAKGESKYTMMDRSGVKEAYGVYPEQIVDFLSLLGDSADNVPGVSGIGEKTARRLLEEYVSIEGIYRHLDDLKPSERKNLTEDRESLELSRKLVVLSYDAVPDDFDINALSASNFTPGEASSDFENLNLRSLVVRAGKKSTAGEEEEREETGDEEKSEPLLSDKEKYLLEKGKYSILQSKDEVIKDWERISSFKGGVVSLYLLSEDWVPSSPILGFAYSPEPLSATYVPVGKDGITEEEMNEIFSSFLPTGRIKVTAHSSKSIISILEERGIGCVIEDDTMIGSWLISSNDAVYSLDGLCGKYFSTTLLSAQDVTNGGRFCDVDTALIARYCSLRADYTSRLGRVVSRRIHEKGLEDIYRNMELPLVRVLADMEREGIYLSLEKMDELKATADSRVRELEESIYLLAGYTFNINSTMQLSKLLYEERGLEKGKKTQRGYSTDTATLEGLKSSGDPIIALLLEYRQLSKLKSTYIDVLPTLRDGNGRVHTTFLQTGTATGRLSSRSPNLQNIPVRTDEGRLIRSAFVPGEGKIFISADYSQIELVVLSWLSGDRSLQEAFLSGEDVHRYTAAMIFNKKSEDVTSAERRVAKTINFGIMYGMSAFRLSNELEITRHEAADFITRYFERYSSVQDFVSATVKDAEEKGYVRTHWGHVREILGINSRNKTEKAAAERTAVNTVIQGTAAEIMKKAMLSVTEEMKKRNLKSRLLLQVHDELIFEVPEEEADEMETMIREKMEGAASLPVPLKVSVERGHSWGDMHA